MDLPYCVIDIETTGLDPATAELTEVAIMEVWPEQTPQVHSWLVQCPIPIPAEVVQLNGISDELLAAEGQHPGKVLYDLINIAEQCEFVVGHNILRFESPFLEARIAQYLPTAARIRLLDRRYYLDTAAIFKARQAGLSRGPNESMLHFSLRVLDHRSRHKFNLAFACEHMNLPLNGMNMHRARDDVRATHDLFELLWSEAEAKR